MILEDIKQKLEEIDANVYYGLCDDDNPVWNYIVFNRVKPSYSENNTSHSDYFDVHIVRENFIPEDLDVAVVAKLRELHGVRLSKEDGRYDYTIKPNTNTVVEALTLHFVRARKCSR